MKKILIVDDQLEVRELVEVTMRVGDYQLLQAKSGEEAIEIVKAEKPDLIIWPETSTPFFNEQQGEYLANISSVAREAGVPLVVGSPRLEVAGNSRGKDSQETVILKNSAFFLSPEGKILDSNKNFPETESLITSRFPEAKEILSLLPFFCLSTGPVLSV